jgi:hypothetical protein
MNRRQFLLGAGTALVAGSAGCVDTILGPTVGESFENTYDVSEGATLSVRNENGSVTVHDTDAEEMTVRGEKRASSEEALADIRVGVDRSEHLVVEADFPTGANFDRRQVDLTVEVPSGVSVDGVETENGDVRVDSVTGDVRATTTNGNVTMTDVDGFVDSETSNGDVRITGATGIDDVDTSNGQVDVELLAMTRDVVCRNSNGPVTVRIGPDVAVAFVLETSNGEASVEELDHTTSETESDRLEGQLRGGTDPTLTLESSNGDVTLRPVEG